MPEPLVLSVSIELSERHGRRWLDYVRLRSFLSASFDLRYLPAPDAVLRSLEDDNDTMGVLCRITGNQSQVLSHVVSSCPWFYYIYKAYRLLASIIIPVYCAYVTRTHNNFSFV